MGQHFASGHSVKITPTTNESGLTVQDLLARPEISQDEIACPLCGTKIPVHANIEEYIKQALQHSPVEISRVYVNIAHPSNTPESQTPPADYPFHIDRIWRYDPISEPSTTPDEETELSMGVKSHDHIITIKPATRGTSAALLLSIPQTQQQEITCPFCDIPLHTAKPLAESIRAFAQQAGSEQAFIAWSVAHPDDIPATKTPPADIPLSAVTYNRTTDNLLEQGLTEGNPTFVLKPKPQDSNG